MMLPYSVGTSRMSPVALKPEAAMALPGLWVIDMPLLGGRTVKRERGW